MPRIHGCKSSSETTYRLTYIEPCHMYSHCQRTCLILMKISYQRQSGGQIQCLTYSHNSTKPIKLVKSGGIPHQICHSRPYTQAAYNQPFTTHTITDNPGNGTHQPIYPQKDRHQSAKICSRLQFTDICHHRNPHSRKHLSIHIVE